MALIPESNISLVGKLKNISLAFVVCLIWTIAMQAFLSLFTSMPPFLSHRSTFSVAGLFFGCVWAPIWEELAFRVVPVTIARTLNQEAVLPVVFLSSIIFGWAHNFGPVSLLFQGFMGFAFSVMYIKNNYCYASAVTLHSMWNLFCFLFF